MRKILATALVLAALCAWGTSLSANAASSSVTVTATIPSLTNLVATGCATGTANVTDFGAVLPGSQVVTSADCALVFGSNNDTAMLRIYQQDGYGIAMARPPTGPLDTNADDAADHFSTDGRLAQAFPAANNEAHGVGLQVLGANAGKTVTAGQAEPSTDRDSIVARWTFNGTLDAGFGSGGSQVLAVDPALNDEFHALAMQPDDKILAAGFVMTASQHDAVLARFTANGSLDATFSGGDGSDGYLVTGVVAQEDTFEDVGVQADGKIVVAGDAAAGNVWVARYNADGTPDTSFNGSGNFVFDPDPGGDLIESLVLQPDGKIVVAGLLGGGGFMDSFVARVNAAGGLDGTFGIGGFRKVDLSGTAREDRARSVGLQPGGAIVIAGYADNGIDWLGMVARFTSGGALDTTFSAGDGTNGYQLFDIGPTSDDFEELIVHEDGRIVVGGLGNRGTGEDDMVVLRMMTDGAMDTTFGGGDGIELLSVTGSRRVEDIVSTPDGKYTLAGFDDGNDHAIMRMESLRLADYADPGNNWTGATTLFGACLESVGAGAVANWPDSASCAARTDADWRGVPAQAGASGKVATTPTSTNTGTAALRFGIKIPTSQAPGWYAAPIVFEVTAPNV